MFKLSLEGHKGFLSLQIEMRRVSQRNQTNPIKRHMHRASTLSKPVPHT